VPDASLRVQIFCAFLNASCQSPQSIMLLTTVSIRKILRSALKASNIESAPEIYTAISGVLSVATAIVAACPFFLKYFVRFEIITNRGEWLLESQKVRLIPLCNAGTLCANHALGRPSASLCSLRTSSSSGSHYCPSSYLLNSGRSHPGRQGNIRTSELLLKAILRTQP